MTKLLVIISGVSGQHAAVVYEAAILSGRNVLGFISPPGATQVLDCSHLGGSDALRDEALLGSARFIVAVGSNVERKQIAGSLAARGAALETIIHPQAIVSPSASIGLGTVILAGAIVATSARIGGCCIVNHGASVDHDCEVADFSNICPGARLGGTVRLGEGAFVGLNACLLQGIQVGARAVIGAGAVVISHVESELTVVGNPAGPVVPKQD